MRRKEALLGSKYKIAPRSADLNSTPPIRLPLLLLLRSVMTYETSPLLPKNGSTQHVEYGLPTKVEVSTYDRFTSGRKRMILALVSLAGMIPRKPFFPRYVPHTALAD